MTCRYEYAPITTKVVNGKLPTDAPGDCMSTVCSGAGALVLFADDKDVPDDQVECTDDQCVGGMPKHPISAVGTPCSVGSKFCNMNQSCVPCTLNAGCTGGTTCYQEQACVSCTDSIKNGNETDVDCGGACGNTCKDGKACKGNADCESNSCASGLCIGCFDGIKNNGEGGVDCGGLCAMKCKDGTACVNAADCTNGQCADGFCCSTACVGTCTACNIPMKEGICSQLAKGHDDLDSMCSVANNKTCDNGNCVNDGGKKHFGEACSAQMPCFSGTCSGQPPTCN